MLSELEVGADEKHYREDSLCNYIADASNTDHSKYYLIEVTGPVDAVMQLITRKRNNLKKSKRKRWKNQRM